MNPRRWPDSTRCAVEFDTAAGAEKLAALLGGREDDAFPMPPALPRHPHAPARIRSCRRKYIRPGRVRDLHGLAGRAVLDDPRPKIEIASF